MALAYRLESGAGAYLGFELNGQGFVRIEADAYVFRPKGGLESGFGGVF